MFEANQNNIGVLAADLLPSGLLVHFSDDTATLFGPEFLYSVRNREGNVSIPEKDDEVAGN